MKWTRPRDAYWQGFQDGYWHDWHDTTISNMHKHYELGFVLGWKARQEEIEHYGTTPEDAL